MNFGSETEKVILSNAVNNIQEKLYVYLGSENSGYSTGDIVSTVSSSGNPLKLRPQSVAVLTDKYIASESETSSSDTHNAGTQISSKLISLLSFFLFIRYFL